MLNRHGLGLRLGIVAFLALQGCSIKPKSYSDVPPAPAGVSEELNQRCHRTAVLASHEALIGLPELGRLFGLLGVLADVGSVSAVSDSAYSSAYEKCLEGGESEL